jgi:predicted DNA-binding transcriptional regulator AlpA
MDDSVYSREEYVSVAELSRRTGLSAQSIYNMISTRTFVKGLHYFKPTRKVLFSWPAIKGWIESKEVIKIESASESRSRIII